MNFGTGAGAALGCICQWYGWLPLLCEDLLFRALSTKMGDYPELPASILAELFMRRWLYPQPPEFSGEWLGKLAPYMPRSRFAAQYAQWATSQANGRTYEMPETMLAIASNELEIALVHALRDGLGKWADAHGIIAFLGPGIMPEEDLWETTPPMADVLLPFRLVDRNLHEPVADFGRRAAVIANNMKERRTNLDDVYVYFPTLPARLPQWMEGESGALAIWFALRANEFGLPRRALDIGLSGCLGRWSATATLDYRTNDSHVVRRKWTMFKRARVPVVVLPDTMVYGGPRPDECVLWPHSQPVGHLMDNLIKQQMALQPDAKEIRRIEAALIEGEEDVNVELAHQTLVGMESKKALGKESARRINFLAYICCCRLGQDVEAMGREQRILDLLAPETRDMAFQLRCAYAISEGNAPRLLSLAAILKKNMFRNSA